MRQNSNYCICCAFAWKLRLKIWYFVTSESRVHWSAVMTNLVQVCRISQSQAVCHYIYFCRIFFAKNVAKGSTTFVKTLIFDLERSVSLYWVGRVTKSKHLDELGVQRLTERPTMGHQALSLPLHSSSNETPQWDDPRNNLFPKCPFFLIFFIFLPLLWITVQILKFQIF